MTLFIRTTGAFMKALMLTTLMSGTNGRALRALSTTNERRESEEVFNGHHDEYQRVDELKTWEEARVAAADLTSCGVSGHLVTITSEAGDDFVKAFVHVADLFNSLTGTEFQIQKAARVWIGAV